MVRVREDISAVVRRKRGRGGEGRQSLRRMDRWMDGCRLTLELAARC